MTAREPVALTGGRWVKGRHGIGQWVDDDGVTAAENRALEWLVAVLERLVEVDAGPVTRTTCATCGCLLTAAAEPCPGCLWWAERDVVRASWRRRSAA